MELWKFGLEVKHDSFQGDGGLFYRWGISKNKLKTKGILGELIRKWKIFRDRLGISF